MNKKVLLLMIASTVLVLTGAILMLDSNSESTPSSTENAIAYTLDPTSFDWGEVNYDDPNKATKIFKIKNKGSDVLKFFNIRTSCHCTVARMSIGGVESQNFGMSGVSSWVGEVGPGKEADLIVVFDQKFHGPAGLGPVSRFVSVETNDKNTPKLTFTLTGNVVKK